MMVYDPDAPGIPAYGIKTKELAPKKKRVYKPKAKVPKRVCPFNEGVECSTFECENCGFNPKRKDGAHES